MIKRIILYIIVTIFIGLNSSAQEVLDSTKRVYTPMRLDPSSNTIAVDSLRLKAEVAYHIEANDTLACKYIELAMSQFENVGDTDGAEYAKLLLLWSQYGCDEFRDDAILKGEKALKIFKESGQQCESAECLSSLAYCYSIKEDSLNLNSKKSVEYCLEALEYLSPLNHGELYASTLSHLSGAYISVGKYQKAIEIADKCITYTDSCLNNIEKRSILFAKYGDAYSLALHNKACALYSLGKYIDCLTCNKKNLQFRLDSWGKTSRYAICARNLAMVEMELGLYVDAFNHFVSAYNAYYEINRLPDNEIIELECYMIDIELKLGELFYARRRLGKLNSIVNNFNFENYPELWGIYLNTVIKYWLHVGDFPNAYYNFDRAYDSNVIFYIDDDTYIQMLINGPGKNDSLAYETANNFQSYYDTYIGKDHINSINNLPNVVKSAMAIDNWNVADSCATRYIYGMREHIGKMFPIMTTEDRELFLTKIQQTLFQYFPSFFNLTRRKGFQKTMYDLSLLQKGILLRTEQELSNLITQSNNHEVLELYRDISDNSAYLKNEDNFDKRDSISNVIQQQMTSLQKLIPSFSEMVNQYNISWYDIKKNLNNDEVAIEFIDIIDHNTGNKSCKALVLKNDWDKPYYVDLFNETDLRNIDKEDYYTTSHLFALIWDPVFAKILQYEDSVKKVYFSPSDMISQIAIESLIDYWDENISKNKEFYRLSSTRELIRRNKDIQINNVVAYGGLKYDATIPELNDINKQFNVENIAINRSSSDIQNGKRAGVHYLPSTKIEMELIEAELQQKGIQSSLFEGLKGTEESFVALNQSETNILHIATHGFYWSQTELDSLQTRRAISMSQLGLNMNLSNEDKAMTRSGLFLSGVNIALSGQEIPNNTCDGILTAYEISKLDLTSVDLAVLSACETGLGDIKSGEGVMGLQRGFKKAGANSILMSLWKVDDDATQKLMVEFYRNFLNGETKAKSLLNAQKTVRETQGFEDPEYWAGFILLDALN